MIPAIRLHVCLPDPVQYRSAGEERQLPEGTPLHWLHIVRIFFYSADTLIPGDEFESTHDSPIHSFIWIGKTIDLRSRETLDVVVLWDGEQRLLLPLSELFSEEGSSWNQSVAILAWQEAKQAAAWEISRPLVVDDITDPGKP